MKGFATNDQANYYSGITSITVNGKNAYELKGKFLDDLHKNAFSGTNEEDVVEHIKYFLKHVNPIDLPNVNQDKLRVIVFLILLVGDAWRWSNGIKGSITCWIDSTGKFFGKYYPPSRIEKINTLIIKWDPTNSEFKNWLASKFMNYMTMYIFTKGALWDYWKLGSDEIKPTNEKTLNLEDTNQDDEQEISEIFRIETNLFNYETLLCEKFKEFNYLLKIDPGVLTNDIVGFKTYDKYKDDWIYELGIRSGLRVAGKKMDIDNELKKEALTNKAIIEGLINEDVESNNEGWDDFESTKVLSIRRIHAHDKAYSTDWPVLRYFLQDLAAKKSTKLVKYQSSGILCLRKNYRLNLKNDMPSRDKGPYEAEECKQNNPAEQNDDVPPWGNIKQKERDDGPEWVIRSKFEDELANFMLKNKFYTKGIGEMLDRHRKEMHEQFFQIFSMTGKNKPPEPEALTFAITNRYGVSTRDPPFPAPSQSTPANHADSRAGNRVVFMLTYSG
ncbi:hypothetical protein Tco_1475206 [Tanacetum coccineum]